MGKKTPLLATTGEKPAVFRWHENLWDGKNRMARMTLQGRSMLRPCNGVVYIKYKLQEQILLYGKTAVPDDIAGTVLYEIEPFGKVVQRYARDLFTGSGCAENHLSKRVADQPFSLLCAPL